MSELLFAVPYQSSSNDVAWHPVASQVLPVFLSQSCSLPKEVKARVVGGVNVQTSDPQKRLKVELWRNHAATGLFPSEMA